MDRSLKSIRGADEVKLRRRRALVLTLGLASMAVLVWAMIHVLGSRGWTPAVLVFLGVYLVGLPWTLLGFWNSVIGFVILRLARDPVGYTNPAVRNTPADSAIVTRTAVCLAVRNEDAAAAFGRLRVMIHGILSTGEGRHFDFHILSDSNHPEVIASEQTLFAQLQAVFPQVGMRYRNRALNIGYKAGNLEEFAKRCRDQYQCMIVLDADSVMSGRAMLRLVRIMQTNPRLGILQTLVAGRPSGSGFTRIFQFGMRHGMRVHTTGAAWWQGSAGSYWGHNAIIRLAPFVDHCRLPTLPGRGPMSGWILSHDQAEAALMYGAGWDVRVIADEFESWEENPTNLPDFIKRDRRWCQGNLQYLKLLGMPELNGMGRFHLTNAIMMYAGAPMNFLMLLAALSLAMTPNPPDFATGMAFGLYATALGLGFAPRLLGVADILIGGQAGRYGGVSRLAAGCLLDFAFSFLIGPIMMLSQSLFIAGLAFGHRMVWEVQNRQDRTVSMRAAFQGLWPQMVFGILAAGILGMFMPRALGWASLTILPCLLAVPFASVTASRAFGRGVMRLRLCAIPEEVSPVRELRLPAENE